MMKIQVLQHVPFEDIGSMASWFSSHGASLQYTRLYASPEPPVLDGTDLLVVLGGPMSVNDEDRFPWLGPEKALLREAMSRGIRVLGVCLGAQLIAAALGARVYPNHAKEIGWFPVYGVGGDESDERPALRFPAASTVFQWHGETFDLPPGAVQLARSAACANQAFRIGHRVVGLQFHLETTPDSASAIVERCRDELVPGPWVQTESEIRRVAPAVYREANRLMGRVLDALWESP